MEAPNFNQPFPKETRKPNCALCKNHNIIKEKKGHKGFCDFDNSLHLANCEICKNTKKRQSSFALEKKNNYISQKIAPKVPRVIKPNRIRVEQKCRKCLNHGADVLMQGHKYLCPHVKCDCIKCAPTNDRRRDVKTEAKIRRHTKRTTDSDVKSPSSSSTCSESGYDSSSSSSVQMERLSFCEDNFNIINNNIIKTESFDIIPDYVMEVNGENDNLARIIISGLPESFLQDIECQLSPANYFGNQSSPENYIFYSQ